MENRENKTDNVAGNKGRLKTVYSSRGGNPISQQSVHWTRRSKHAEVAVSSSYRRGRHFILSQQKNHHRKAFKQTLWTHLHVGLEEGWMMTEEGN